MAIKYPPILPTPTIQGYRIKQQDNTVRTRMEAGVARQRRRFLTVPTDMRLRWVMQSSLFALFEGFYKTKAKEGAEWIIFPIYNGAGYLDSEVRFKEPYQATLLSDNTWQVTADMEIREAQVLTEDLLDLFLNISEDANAIGDMASDLDDLINKTLPPLLI